MKTKQNYLMDQEQVDYLEFVKKERGVPYSVTVRRLINEAIDNDSEYLLFLSDEEKIDSEEGENE